MIRKYLKEKNGAFYVACACAILSLATGILTIFLPNRVDGVFVSATSGIMAISGAAAFVVMGLADYFSFYLRRRKGETDCGVNFLRMGTIFMGVLVFVSFLVLAAESAEFLVSGITDYTMDSSGSIFDIPGIVEIGVCLGLLLVFAIVGNVLYWVPSRKNDAAKAARKAAKVARKAAKIERRKAERNFEDYVVRSGEYLKGKNGSFYAACICAVLSFAAGIVTIVLPYGVEGASVSSTPGLIAIVGAFAFVAMAFVDYISFYRRYRRGETEYGVNFVRIGVVFMTVLVFVSFLLLAAESAEFLVSGITDYTMDSSGGILGIPGIVEIGVCLIVLLALAIVGNVLYWVPSRKKLRENFDDYGIGCEDYDFEVRSNAGESMASEECKGGEQA